MVQIIRTNDDQDLEVLHSQLRECFGRVTYSHKTHEKCADILQRRLRWTKLAQITLSAATTTGLFYAMFSDHQVSLLLTTVASALLFITNLYVKEHGLAKLIQQHITSATDLWNVRESYISLLVDIHNVTIDDDYLRQKRDELQETLKSIYHAAPRTLPAAYRKAQNALKLDDELTFNDGEIDIMLPVSLRRGNDDRKKIGEVAT